MQIASRLLGPWLPLHAHGQIHQVQKSVYWRCMFAWVHTDLDSISFRLVVQAAVRGEHGCQALDSSPRQGSHTPLPT